MIKIYGKKGCPDCDRVKEILRENGVEFEEHDLEYHLEHHDEWRENGSVELAAHCHLVGIDEVELPVVQVKGKYYRPEKGLKKAIGKDAQRQKECSDGACRLK